MEQSPNPVLKGPFALRLALLMVLVLAGCQSPSEPIADEDPGAIEDRTGACDPDTGLSDTPLIFSAHQDRVLDLAFSADGEILATSGRDLKINLWDPASGALLESFQMELVDMADIDISLQDNLLASGEAIWDLDTYQELTVLERGSALPAFVAFTPDGKTLALANLEQETYLWDLTSESVVFRFPVMEEPRSKRMEFSPDGLTLFESVIDGTIRIWNVQKGELTQTLHYSGETDIHDIAISPDGNYLAQAGRVPKIVVWDLSSGEAIQAFRTRDNMNGVAFSTDGRTLAASAGAEKAVLLWDLESGDSLGSLPLSDQSMALGFSPDGRWLASGTFDGQLYLWEICQIE